MNILVAAPMEPSGLDLLKGVPDLRVDLMPDISLEELHEKIGKYEALIAGISMPIGQETLGKAGRLRLIGLIGTGSLGLDLDAATRKGILVMNAPGSAAVSVAEHAISLIFALARRIPEADYSVKKGAWFKAQLMGTGIRNKVLGIIGFGAVGSLVAERAMGMKMHVVVCDPHVSSEAVQRSGCRKAALEELFAVSDIISIHVPLNPETRGVISEKTISLMKPGVMLINCSAPEIIDEEALYSGIISGKVAGAALDLRREEPIEEHPLYLSDEVICTPDLGVHTREAMVEASMEIAGQVADYLQKGKIIHALNLPDDEGVVSVRMHSWMDLGEVMGRFVIQLHSHGLRDVEIDLAGEDGVPPIEAVTRSVLKGVLGQIIGESVNLVNSKSLAHERGIRVTETRRSSSENFRILVTVTLKTDQGRGMISGTLFDDMHLRIVRIDGFDLEAVPDGDFLVIFNRDRPGVIADVGETLGRHSTNIGQMYNGRDAQGGTAITLLRIDSEVSDDVLKDILKLPNILNATRVHMAEKR